MNQRWRDPEPIVVPRSLREAVGGHPLVAETLARRGVRTPAEAQAFLDPEAYVPAPPDDLPGISKAIARIWRAIEAGERICVWGDFDVDGQTSTTVLVSTLRDLAADVIYHIPVRATESHGIKVPWLAQELEKGVQLILTCDTGIGALEAVAYAQSRGVDVVITDHHELPEELPDAFAIVDPHLLPEEHPLSTLPGVGVAYKLAEALYARADRRGEATKLLDLVALGVVADVAVQTGDTRYLLQQGLSALRSSQRLGLQELMKVAGVAAGSIDEESIGFALAPRLNALGRLSDAADSVELLTTQDLARARILASQLEALNAQRRLLCDQVEAGAESQFERNPALLESSVIVLADPRWPAGVIGIVANRLADRHKRPAVLLASPAGETARGSARSIAGCNITKAIAEQQHLLEGYGGHAMAAGLSIDPSRIDEFRKGLDKAVSTQLATRLAETALEVHGYVTLGELSIPLVTDLERLAPFGPGNPPLTLVACDLKIVGKRELGRAKKHLRVTVEDSDGVERSVVWWNWQQASLPDGRCDVAFNIRINEFRGVADVQLVWQDARNAEAVAPVPAVEASRSLEVVDWRGAPDAEQQLLELLSRDGDVEVWAEGPQAVSWAHHHRLELAPAQTLVIWSCPPSTADLRTAMKRVKASRIVLVGSQTGLDEPTSFRRYLAGLVKYALSNRDGSASVPDLAAAMGHREASIRAGLAWMEARGMVHVVDTGGLVLRLEGASSTDAERAAHWAKVLHQSLVETVGYRRQFHRTSDRRLVEDARH